MISVIVPIYKVEDYLEKCIESVLSQTYENIEIILVDDGSPDNSIDICKRYQKKDKRIRIIRQENQGVSVARNTGIREARGKYITFLDSDDWIESTMYEDMIKQLNKTDAQVCVCNNYYRDYKNEEEVRYGYLMNRDIIGRDEAVKLTLKFEMPISLWSTVYEADVIKKMYLKQNIHTLEDFEYQLRVMAMVKRVTIIQTPYYHYRHVEGSASRAGINRKVLTAFNIVDDLEKSINSNFPKLNIYAKEVLPRIVLSIANVGIKSNCNEMYANKVMRNKARKSLVRTILSKNLAISSKVNIIMISIHPVLFYKIKPLIKNIVRGRDAA